MSRKMSWDSSDREEKRYGDDGPPPPPYVYNKPSGSHDGEDGVSTRPRRTWSRRDIAIMFLRGFLLVPAFIVLFHRARPSFAAPAASQGAELANLPADNWQRYVRAPKHKDVAPARVLSQYTKGNVTNPNGLVSGKGSTILTRTQPPPSEDPDVPSPDEIVPAIVVDFGQNMPGLLTINFDGSQNFSTGRPGIRLAFSETLEFLTDLSDFSRSNNVSIEGFPPRKHTYQLEIGRYHYPRLRSG